MRRYLILLLGCVFWGLAIVPGVYSSWQDQLYIRGEIRLNDVSPLRSVEQGSDSNLARKVDEHKGTVAGTGEVPDHKAEEGRVAEELETGFQAVPAAVFEAVPEAGIKESLPVSEPVVAETTGGSATADSAVTGEDPGQDPSEAITNTVTDDIIGDTAGEATEEITESRGETAGEAASETVEKSADVKAENENNNAAAEAGGEMETGAGAE